MEENIVSGTINYKLIVKKLWAKRNLYFKVLPLSFIIAILWALPKPYFYSCEVKLAPEIITTTSSGLSSLASSLGVNLSNATSRDAIYPMLYPELLGSPEFIVGLFDVQIETADGKIQTDYYSYLNEHQKKNWLTDPVFGLINSVVDIFRSEKEEGSENKKIDSFRMSKKDYRLVSRLMKDIKCSVDKKTNVISIQVKDQDPLVCALMADSVRVHLQNFIINYRTKKVKIDEMHYKQLTDSAKIQYDLALEAYATFKDSHKNVQSYVNIAESERLKHELDFRFSSFNSFNTQYQAMKAKVQEQTPAFTVLKSATVPIKAAGPKKVQSAFVFTMFVLFLLFCYSFRQLLKE